MRQSQSVRSIVLVGVVGPLAGAACDTHGGHSHEREKMLLVDIGSHHGALTAHLAKAGNELDIFFETGGDSPQPVAIPAASFTATATTAAGATHELVFEPAPASERPAGENPGTCSHFVARAPWLKPNEEIQVTAKVKLESGEATATWKKFLPSNYAHHVE